MTRAKVIFASCGAFALLSLLMPTPGSHSGSQNIDIDHVADGLTPSPALLLARFDKSALPPAPPPRPPLAQPNTVARTTNPLNQSVIRGVVQSDEASLLLVDHQGRLTTLREGDVFLGFTVMSIDERSVRFDNGAEQVSLALPASQR